MGTGTTFTDPSLTDMGYTLHPVQQKSVDEVLRTVSYDTTSGSFTIPGHTTAVFVIKEKTDMTLPIAIGAGAVVLLGAVIFLLTRKKK